MSTLNLWKNFTKRKNSTKQPAGAADYSQAVLLKDGTSLEQPVFVISSNEFGYNYAQYEGSYYYVDDIVSLKNNLIEVHCSKDVLATYKSQIKAGSAYVLYYTHTNTEISDKRLATKTTAVLSSNTETFNNLGTGESYMITVVGDESTSVFACDKSYIDNLFDQAIETSFDTDYDTAVDTIISAITSQQWGTTIDAIIAVAEAYFSWLKLGKTVTNSVLYANEAAEYVKNCYVLPIEKSHIGGTLKDPIMIGKWESNAKGNKGFPRIVHDSATLAIPWQASDWRRNSPYHHIYLYIPYVGLVDLTPSELIGATNITVNVAVDTYSGVTSFVVNADNGAVLGQYTTNIAAPYAIGSSNINLVSSGAQIIASATSIAAGAATGNILAATGGALGIVNALKPIDQSVSSNGGAAGMGLGNTVKIFSIFHDTTVAPSSVSAIAGTPFNGVMSLNISGYVQTAGASIDIPGFGNDKDQVNNYLNGGIYIE